MDVDDPIDQVGTVLSSILGLHRRQVKKGDFLALLFAAHVLVDIWSVNKRKLNVWVNVFLGGLSLRLCSDYMGDLFRISRNENI